VNVAPTSLALVACLRCNKEYACACGWRLHALPCWFSCVGAPLVGAPRWRRMECCVILETTKPRRRSMRLRGYDYAQAGAYFITICSQGRACPFGEVSDGAMCMNAAEELAASLWGDIPKRFSEVDLDAFVVMPDHIHGIIVLPDPAVALHSSSRTGVDTLAVGTLDDGARRAATRAAPTIGGIVGTFKSLFTVEYIRGVKKKRWAAFDHRVWQRNYYEHVIRDESDLARIRCYIDENPLRWELDDENPQRVQEGAHKGRPYDLESRDH